MSGAGSDYDWSATDPKRARERMKEVAEQQERLGKKINKKVLLSLPIFASLFPPLARLRLRRGARAACGS